MRFIVLLCVLFVSSCSGEQAERAQIYVPYWAACESTLERWFAFWKPQYEDWTYEVILPDKVPGVPAPINGLVRFDFPASDYKQHKRLADSFQFKCSPTTMIELTSEKADEVHIREVIARAPGITASSYDGPFFIRIVGERMQIFFNAGAKRG